MENCSAFTHPKDGPPTERESLLFSFLPALTKAFERLVLKQLISYIDEFYLLALSISGFRKGHSSIQKLRC